MSYYADYDNLARYNDPYYHQRKKQMVAECGVADGPRCTLVFERGWTVEQCLEELKSCRDIIKEPLEFDFPWPSTPDEEGEKRKEKYDREQMEFANAPFFDLYVVFCEDCQPLDPPIVDPQKLQHFPGHSFGDEWNVLGNWNPDCPAFHEVWKRRSISWAEAVRRVTTSQVEPEPPAEIFKVNPQYKKDIDDIRHGRNPLVRLFCGESDELSAAYATLAAKKLMALQNVINPTPFRPVRNGHAYYLQANMCDYDNWEDMYEFLQKHCTIADWKEHRPHGCSPRSMPTATFDLSRDKDFNNSSQTQYTVKIEYYDSHACGW